MKRALTLLLVTLLLSSLIGCSSGGGTDAMQSSLAGDPAVTALAEKVGVSANQAVGGLGAILSMAKNKVSADDFSKLTSGIPSAQKFIDEAGKMGVDVGSIKDAIQLKDSFTKLGMSEQAVSAFGPAAINYVRSVGGEGAASVLSDLGF